MDSGISSISTVRNLLNIQKNLKNGIILGLSCIFCIGYAVVVKKKDFDSIKEEGFVETLNTYENIVFEAKSDTVKYVWYKFIGNPECWSFKNPVYINFITSEKQSVPDFNGKKIRVLGSETHEIVVNKKCGTIIQRGIVYK